MHSFSEERQKLKALVDNSPDFMGISNNNNVIEYLNKAAYKLLGIDENTDLSTLKSADFYAVHEAGHMHEIYKTLQEKGHWEGRVLLRHFKTGELIPGHGHYVTVIDPATGLQIGKSTTVRDLRAELNAKQALYYSEERTKSIVEQAPVAIGVLVGPDLVVESANKTILKVWGKEASIIGKPILEALPEIKGQGFFELLQGVYQTGTPVHGSSVLAKLEHNGKIEDLYFDFVYSAVRDHKGEINGVMVVASEVTAQVLATKIVQESEAKFRGLIEEAPVPTAVLVGRGLVIDIVNESMLKLWDKSDSILNMPLAEALPELEGQPFLKILDNIFDTGQAFEAQEAKAVLLLNGKPTTYYFNYAYKPLFDQEGKVYAIIDMAIDVTQQVLVKQELERSQQQLLAYFEQSPVAIAIIGEENLTFRMTNPFYAELVGRKPEDLIDKPLLEALPELTGQGFDDLLRNVISTGVPFIAKERAVEIQRNNKLETIYVNLTYQPRREPDQRISGVLVVATDVTQLVLARKQAEESELFSRTIIHTSPVAKMVLIGRDMEIMSCNEKMMEMIGRDGSVIGKTFLGAMPELEKTDLMKRMTAVFDTGETYIQPEEKIDLVRFGKPHIGYYNYIYKALRATSGEIYGIIITAMEVTEQVTARQKIEEAEAGLRGAIDLANLGTWSIDLKSRTLDYDERLRNWFGFTKDEVITPERAASPCAKEDLPRLTEAIVHAITPGTDGMYDVEYHIKNQQTGLERILHAQGRAFTDKKGEVYKISGSVQDVTKERKIELELTQQVQERTEELAATNEELAASNEELQAMNEEMTVINEEMEEANRNLNHSNEELSQYAYVASHDLQEPLRKIRVYAGILNKQSSLTAENRPLVNKINQASERMTLLIKDLLEFSRLVKSENILKPVDLNDIASQVITDFELSITEKNAAVRIQRLPVIDAVALQMNQLFYNIIGNALKFTDPEKAPQISIESSVAPIAEVRRYIARPAPGITYYDISVKDNGIGFEEKYADQIFEVFKRLHGRDIYPGSGIGLALCRRIVANHGGHLYAESQLGEGTIFHMILPGKSPIKN